MAHAWFLMDAATVQAKPFLRARECRFLADGRILALNYAPFDTPAADIRKISLSPEREKNTKAAGLFSAAGDFLKDAPGAFAGAPSPDGKRFLDALESDGRNNYQCVRKLTVQAEEGEPIVLTAPIEAKPGRLVGFRQYEWHGSGAIRASVVDMNEREARHAPPGMYLSVTPAWFECSLETRAWKKLAGEELKEATSRRVPVEGGTIFFMEDAIKLVRGGETKVLPWPDLKDGSVDMYAWAFSPDGTYGVVKVGPSQRGVLGKGAAPGKDPAAQEKSLLGLWLIDFSKPAKTRLEFPHEEGEAGNARFDAMGWVGGGTFALVQYVSTATVIDARGTVVTDFKGASYYLDAATGKLEPFAIRGIPWIPFLRERSANAKDCVAVLMREGPGRPDGQEFRVAVVRAKGDARRLRPPEGFRVGYQSGLWMSPDGRTLAVSESRGTKLWLVPTGKEE